MSCPSPWETQHPREGWLRGRLEPPPQHPVPQPGAGSADLVGAGAGAQHQRAHAELLLVVLHPFAGRADGDVIPLPVHLRGEERDVSAMSPLHRGGAPPAFLQS